MHRYRAIAVLALGAFLARGHWRTVLRLPVIVYPVIFAVDLFVWLYYAGHSLDPKAPMSSSIPLYDRWSSTNRTRRGFVRHVLIRGL